MKALVFMLTVTALPLLLAACSAGGGSALYDENCRTCHSFKGEGGNAAPDLTAVTGARSTDWIQQQIVNPKKNNPRSRMPSYEHLSGREVRAIIRHLGS